MLPEGITLRQAARSDDGFLRNLYASTRSEEMALLDWSDAEKYEFLTMQFDAQTAYWAERYPHTDRLIVTDRGQPVGRLYLDRRDDEIRVVDIALLSEYRGRGVGRALMQQVISEAHGCGKAVRIHVERNNPALRLYQRLGFVAISEHGIYLLMELVPPNRAEGSEPRRESPPQ